MTREEAWEFIAQSVKSDVDMAKVADAIKALEQEPCENNICDSCHTKGCIFQSGIKRVNCEFYTAQNEPCNDAISRESLLNKLCGYHVDIEKSIFDKLWRVIKDMPPVTPQEPETFKWCTDCKEYDQEKHCCHRWSKVIRDTVDEMKQEYIEREVLDKIRAEIKELQTYFHEMLILDEVMQIIDKYKAESEEQE